MNKGRVFRLALLLTAGLILAGCGGVQAGSPPSGEIAGETDLQSSGTETMESVHETETAFGESAGEGTGTSAHEEGTAAESDHGMYTEEKERALEALLTRKDAERETVYVYHDFGVTENHFTQKAKMAGIRQENVLDMNENWQEDPREGSSCIRCEQITRTGDWGGWLFLNGYLPKGESVPLLNDGSKDGQGIDLSGAESLCFYAKGENGGEVVEFFTAGFGYDGTTGRLDVNFPDSAQKQSLGQVQLTKQWKEFSIPLEDADMSDIVCGFGYVLNDEMDGNADVVFYLDEIRFTGKIRSAEAAPVMLRSYDTQNIYIRNTAFSYDNALAAMAFLSEGRKSDAQEILDAFVYAVQNDRAMSAADGQGQEKKDNTRRPARLRNAYAAGDISAYPGWESGARLPGWYDQKDGKWYEDRYQVGSNVGNTSYAALALMQYYHAYGGDVYLETACRLMDWVIENCSDGRDGFTGGFDGWEEGSPPVVYPFTYKSIEHNIDAYAAFTMLYEATGEAEYEQAAGSALRFIQSMYDPAGKCFMTGTLEDGITPNTSVVVLDAQVWSAMALGDHFEKYADALKVVETMKTEEGGYPFCLENRNGGWWAEGTAYTALMYKERKEEAKYEEAMNALVSVHLANGLFPAATTDHLSTGMDLFDGTPWEYSTDAHIAPTAWFIMAANGFNPYVLQNAR